MRLVTIRTANGTRAGRVQDDRVIDLDAPDVGVLLSDPDWPSVAAAAGGPGRLLADADLATLVPRPSKVICLGLNYASHIQEMGRELPKYPTLFAKFPGTLIGAYDPILLPRVSEQVDWEVELGVVIGRPARHPGRPGAGDPGRAAGRRRRPGRALRGRRPGDAALAHVRPAFGSSRDHRLRE